MRLPLSAAAWVLALAGLWVLFWASAASAATLRVTTTLDRISPGDHACSLREAIAAVDSPGTHGDCGQAGAGANTILLGAHVYGLSIGASGADDNSTGDLDVQSTHLLTIVGAGVASTTISAAGLSDRLFNLATGTHVTILGLTLTGGHAGDGLPGQNAGIGAAQPGGAGQNGGAIANAGTLVLIGDAVTSSSAGNGGSGGAGQIGSPGGAAGGNGGAGGGIYNTGTLELSAVTVSGNRAGNGGSGGAGGENLGHGGGGGSGGCCGGGGGIENAGGAVTVRSSTISSNRAGDGGSGGAGGPAIGPGTSGAGGGGGSGSAGGGISSAGGTLSITNSTIAANSSGGGAGGGAVYVSADGSSALTNVTISGNQGGGVYARSASPMLIRNTVLASDLGSNCAGLLADGGHDLSFGDMSCPSTFATGNPRLGVLQDNGGWTATAGLGSGSAAIDQVPASGSGCPVTDQRGVARPSGTGCDIGAYEVAPPAATTIVASRITSGGATLNGAVTPNAHAASIEFEYGRTAVYGARSAPRPLGGVQSTPFAAGLTGLLPDTSYHYRIVASSPDGHVTGADRTFTTAPLIGSVPRLMRVTIKSSRFKPTMPNRHGRAPETITYTDTLPARTTLVIRRVTSGRSQGRRCVPGPRPGHGHRCALLTAVDSFTHMDRKGVNTLPFGGRLNGRKLKPGRYELRATPELAGRVGKTVTCSFRIL